MAKIKGKNVFKLKIVSLIVALFFILPIVNSDFVSVNSGGGDELVVTPGKYIEGFFSCFPETCSSLGVECDSWSNSCGTIINCGTCSSGYTCTSGTCVAIPSLGDEVTSTGGGGGIGVAPTETKEKKLTIIPSELSISVIEGIEETRDLTLKNTGEVSLSIYMETTGEIENVLTLSESNIFLETNEEKISELNILAYGRKLITGKILVTYSGIIEEIPVVIATKSENFLFDISIFLGNKFKRILIGERIEAQFNLIEVGTEEKVDVVANYIIKDFEGNKHYEESETFFVLGEKEYTKEFPTENLPKGKYVLGFEITYPGAFAVSSATFDIQEEGERFSYVLITVISIVGVLIILLVILSSNRLRNKNTFRKRK